MPKYMVRCDVEGVSGIVSYTQAKPGAPEYVSGRKLFMGDLLALLEGLQEGGADEVILYDEHAGGRNVDLEQIPDFCRVICGCPPYRSDWPGGIDNTFDGMILLGYHAKHGTSGALLPHTYESDIKDIRLNGISLGEIGIETAIAGDYGVPSVMITGDSASIQEATSLCPGIVAVIVKDSINEHSATCYPLQSTRAVIRRAAVQVASDPPDVNPYHIFEEVTLAVVLKEGVFLESLKQDTSSKMKNENTIILHGTNVTDVWVQYLTTKRRAFASIEQFEQPNP